MYLKHRVLAAYNLINITSITLTNHSVIMVIAILETFCLTCISTWPDSEPNKPEYNLDYHYHTHAGYIV